MKNHTSAASVANHFMAVLEKSNTKEPTQGKNPLNVVFANDLSPLSHQKLRMKESIRVKSLTSVTFAIRSSGSTVTNQNMRGFTQDKNLLNAPFVTKNLAE